MGWYFGNDSRKQLVDELTRTQENESGKWETLRKAFSGNTLWTVRRVTRKDNGQVQLYIGCDLLMRSGGDWGYKPMDESMGPCELTCPVGFFDLVPCPEGFAVAWRERVREYRARVNQKLAIGQLIALTNGKLYEVVSLKPLHAKGADGVIYRVPRRMLTVTVPEVNAVAAL